MYVGHGGRGRRDHRAPQSRQARVQGDPGARRRRAAAEQLLAFYIARWRSGLLPVAASFAIILLIFSAISGPQWFDRDRAGFDDPLLEESIVGILTVLLVPLQVLLIAVAARGFQQKWSVEVERRRDGVRPYVAQPH